MVSFFSNPEASILVRLLIAHCLTEFFLQPNKWVIEKRRKIWGSKYLWYHGLLTGIVAWLFLASLNLWWSVVIIMITHIIIDGIKLQFEKRYGSGILLFLADQCMHVVVVTASWLWIISGWEKVFFLLKEYLPQYHLLLRVLGYLIMVGPVGYIIQFLTRKWLSEINPDDSLQNAGKWIGILERILTLTFVCTNQFGAMGFLITARSLLRVIDKPDKPNGEPTLIKPFRLPEANRICINRNLFKFFNCYTNRSRNKLAPISLII